MKKKNTFAFYIITCNSFYMSLISIAFCVFSYKNKIIYINIYIVSLIVLICFESL